MEHPDDDRSSGAWSFGGLLMILAALALVMGGVGFFMMRSAQQQRAIAMERALVARAQAEAVSREAAARAEAAERAAQAAEAPSGATDSAAEIERLRRENQELRDKLKALEESRAEPRP